jgi:hypothetical protein
LSKHTLPERSRTFNSNETHPFVKAVASMNSINGLYGYAVYFASPNLGVFKTIVEVDRIDQRSIDVDNFGDDSPGW